LEGIAKISSGLITKEPAFLILILSIAIVLLVVSQRLWWIHWLIVPVICFVGYFYIPKHSIALEILFAACATYPLLNKNMPTQKKVFESGIYWFSGAAIVIAVLLATPNAYSIYNVIYEIQQWNSLAPQRSER
jgi:hypothetical protein